MTRHKRSGPFVGTSPYKRKTIVAIKKTKMKKIAEAMNMKAGEETNNSQATATRGYNFIVSITKGFPCLKTSSKETIKRKFFKPMAINKKEKTLVDEKP